MSWLAGVIRMQREWSEKTFGPGLRTEGNCKHIEKELAEIRDDPLDVEEWIDVAMLAFDGAWRVLEESGVDPILIGSEIEKAYLAKLKKNIARKWAVSGSQDEPNLHVKEPQP